MCTRGAKLDVLDQRAPIRHHLVHRAVCGSTEMQLGPARFSEWRADGRERTAADGAKMLARVESGYIPDLKILEGLSAKKSRVVSALSET